MSETETESGTTSETTPIPEGTSPASTPTTTPDEESLIGGKVEEKADETLIGGKTDNEDRGPAFGVEALDTENLVVPETIELNEDQSSEFMGLVNGAESKVDLANKMLAMYADVAGEAAEAGANAFVEMNEIWVKEIETDKELGGSRQEESLAVAKGLVDRYGSGAEFNKILHLTGMGNNLEFLRFLHKINSDLPQQATPATGTPAGGSRSLADRLFNTT